MFTVKLEKFDAAAKAKVIREIKAILPGANLVEVISHPSLLSPLLGQEVRGVCSQGHPFRRSKRGGREAESYPGGCWCNCCPGVKLTKILSGLSFGFIMIL